MALLQKILGTTWWNNVLKTREILLELLSNLQSLEERVEVLEQLGEVNPIATEEWVIELLDGNRNQGIEAIVLDGLTTVYSIPHDLGVVPAFAYAGRGNSTNFDVFNTTWDSVNIIITYENPPVVGTLNINWIALK